MISKCFKLLFAAFAFSLFPISAHSAIITSPISYQHGQIFLQGYLAYDDSIKDKRPGVLVFHEYRGLDDHAMSKAEELAQMGYVAFAVDMYGKGIYAKDHDEAAQMANVYRKDRNLMRTRAYAGYQVLKNHPLVDGSKIAAIGYSFGGTTVLEMARAGYDLVGVASFHGALDTPVPAEKNAIKSKILVFQGGEDPYVTKDQVDTFEQEMTDAKVDWRVVVLGGATHSFTVHQAGNDKSKGAAYDETADKRSWQILELFFKEIFGETTSAA